MKPYILLSSAIPCWPSCGLYLHGGGEGLCLTEELRLCVSSWFSCPVLVLQASSAPLSVLPTISTNTVETEKCLLWSTLLTCLSGKLNLPPIHFFPSPWCLWQGKPSVLQPFYLSLGREMQQSYRIACSLMSRSSLSDLLHANLALTV